MIEWNGEHIKHKITHAAELGINETMSECVGHAKSNHDGWRNRTGDAERSVRIISVAEPMGDEVEGTWGSVGVDYVWYLEYLHGSFLRDAAANMYPTLPIRIKRFMGMMA
jgi:hypothetical protein